MIKIKPLALPDIPADGGTVTAVTVQKKDADRCSIYLDEKFAFGIHVDLVLEAGLKKDLRLTEDECRELVSRDFYFKALKRCMSFIAYRPRTEFEIRTRLKELGVPDEISKRVMDRMLELGYLNDKEFARQWAETRSRSKGFGPLRLQMELQKKGIDQELAREAVLDTCSDELVLKNLQDQMKRAIHRYRRDVDITTKKRKIVGFLSRRGFSTADIIKQMDEHKIS